MGQLAEDNKALQATALVGEAGIGIAKMVIANNQANIGALATPQAIATSGVSAKPVIAFNNISTGLGVAAAIAATSKGLSALGKGGAPSGGGQAGGASAPSFNLVEGTDGTSQIQNSIEGLGSKPLKAYVLSGDVTSQQAADRAAEANSGF